MPGIEQRTDQWNRRRFEHEQRDVASLLYGADKTGEQGVSAVMFDVSMTATGTGGTLLSGSFVTDDLSRWLDMALEKARKGGTVHVDVDAGGMVALVANTICLDRGIMLGSGGKLTYSRLTALMDGPVLPKEVRHGR